jgi:methylthioribulose-1-phosphate dehydratase
MKNSAVLAGHNWAPATAGNYSIRLPDGLIAITVSGEDKGDLGPHSVMTVDAGGKATDHRKPSAETLLHIKLYEHYPGCHAVLHTHSVASTVLTRRYAQLSHLTLTDYEFLKLFPGIASHSAKLEIPIIDNSQDMQALSAKISPLLSPDMRAYLIRGHGLYVWSENMTLARRLTEAVEFMLSCELELRRERNEPIADL